MSLCGLQSGATLGALLSLAFVVFLIHLFYLYICLFHGRHGAARQLNSPLPLLATTSGLDMPVLCKLPIVECPTADNDCAVCLARLELGELARLLSPCRHFFHVECIDMWLYSHSSCPICRARVDDFPEVCCSSTAREQLPAQDIGDVELSGVTAAAAAAPWTSKDEESPAPSRLSLSLRRILSRVTSERMTAPDFPSDIESA